MGFILYYIYCNRKKHKLKGVLNKFNYKFSFIKGLKTLTEILQRCYTLPWVIYMEEKTISIAVIKRLPRYYRYLGDLLDNGITRISSGDLSKKMNVTASQIRQDLNKFGCFGQQGYGYNVQFLYEEIGKIMGLNTEHRIIIIGAGNLGQALANYVKFEKLGFVITALFDVNPALSGKSVRGIPILMLSELDEYCRTHRVDIAALTMPKSKADSIASKLVDLGIRAIWNFAHVDLEIPNKDVVVESVHLSDSLMQLSYNIVKNSKNK